MGADPSKRLVPDELWELAAPLLPSFAARPQGGGTAPCDERAVFTAVVDVLTSGCAWRHLPPTFGTSPAHRDDGTCTDAKGARSSMQIELLNRRRWLVFRLVQWSEYQRAVGPDGGALLADPSEVLGFHLGDRPCRGPPGEQRLEVL